MKLGPAASEPRPKASGSSVPGLSKRWLAVVVVLLLGAALLGGLAFTSPKIYFLTDTGPGKWVIYPTPADGSGLPQASLGTEFKRTFALGQVPPASLKLRALQRAEVRLNGRPVPDARKEKESWRHACEFALAGFLQPGTNEISITVYNPPGLPALAAELVSGNFRLPTDESWQASYAGGAWRPCQAASKPLPIERGNLLYGGPTLGESFQSRLPWLAVFLIVAAGLVFAWKRAAEKPQTGFLANPERRAWIPVVALGAAWLLLWSNNIGYLPVLTGFDVNGHLDYINYILKQHALPLANEGFQMYQPPLYYLICAGLLSVVRETAYDPGGVFVLRLFGMGCGIAMFTFVFLSLRLLFPGRRQVHWLGLLLAAVLPVNLYLCQYITNEYFAATLSAASIYVCLRILRSPDLNWKAHAGLGALCGAALLAKSSALVIPAVCFVAVAWNIFRRDGLRSQQYALCIGWAAVCCLLVCGWHYGRVAAHFGNPLIGNWDPQTGFVWWQHPGYRTAAFYAPLPLSLGQPLYSSFSGMADGIYTTLWGDGLCGGKMDITGRPPWDWQLMCVGYVLAIVPTALVLIGIVVMLARFLRNPEPEYFLMLSLGGGLFFLLLYYSLKIPSAASAKAFYAAGALVALCAVGALGWDYLAARSRGLRIFLNVAITLWALNTYASFWIQHDAQHTQILAARSLSTQGRHDLAVHTLIGLVERNGHDTEAVWMLGQELMAVGRVNDARQLLEDALTWNEGSARCHLILGNLFASQGQLTNAIPHARRALQLAPDDTLASQNLAQWLFRNDQYPETVVACREALRIDPTMANLHWLLGSVLARQGQYSNAVAPLTRANALQGEWPEALDALGTVYQHLHRYGDALGQFQQAVQLQPKVVSYRYHLASAQVQLGRVADAYATARTALETARAAGDAAGVAAGEKFIRSLPATHAPAK